MLARAVQLALSRGAEAESAIAADEALSPLDPLLRWRARRRLERLLRRAELETTLPELAHRFRLAYVLGAGQAVSNPDDASEVAALAAAIAPPPSVGRRGPWLTTLVLLAALSLLGGALALRSWFAPFSPKRTAAGQLLGTELASHVVALSRADAAEVKRTRELLLEDASKVLGEDARRALASVLDGMLQLRRAPLGEAEPRVHAFQNAVSGLDRVLAAAGQPYFVVAVLRPRSSHLDPLPMSYYVQTESQVRGVRPPIRVLRLWRLDDLNVSQGYLGFTRPHTPAAIVLLDQVEADLVRFTLPGAAINGRVELLDQATRETGESWTLELEDRASDVARAHYQSLGGPLAEDAIRIGTLLSRRRDLVRKWQASLRGQGLELRVPKRLFPELDYAADLSLRVPRADLQEWDGIHEELAGKLGSFEVLRDRFVQGVERHEVQHRLDYARGLIPVPPLLCALLGLENSLDAPPGTLAARARDETSAYLAELARAESAPIVELLILSHFMLNRELPRSAYTYAALTVYVALGRALGMDVEAFLAGRTITRERFARLALALWVRPAKALRAAALRAYQAEFGVPLAEVRIEERRANPRYRPEH